MMDAVFISDLHLHPDMPDISARFKQFLEWVPMQTKTLYILGDFLHVWAGDDTSNTWSNSIAASLADLSAKGMRVYFMRGNRDFLLGDAFFKRARLIVLEEPTAIELGGARIVLVHGDRYCTKDTAHQWFRRLTRNRWFPRLFLKLPVWLRLRIVMGVRSNSASSVGSKLDKTDIVPQALIKHLNEQDARIVVHGHTHKPGLVKHQAGGDVYYQYVLSDWDASPTLLCYDKSKGFNFILSGEGHG
ncbi:MAG: UDP-2,3-diacylglucosamine diphosphatase [Legionellaceae bacterium]|nr:UDP-2,3-diacylglucosamine diphosphatase [Legionellaceae bacterium]